ncbi:MAG: sulfatase-like hydrolase/transferase [Luteolibacter sp.]
MAASPFCSEGRSPNIVVIMADDLGWNHHSIDHPVMRGRRGEFHTPHLEELASRGMIFSHAYAQPNCAPTRACLLTGQYPCRVNHQVYSVGNLNRFGGGVSRKSANFTGPEQSEDVAAAAVTLAEVLRMNGYATAHFGKYHVGGHDGSGTLPENQGFALNVGGGPAGHQKACFASKSASGWEFKQTGYGALDRFAEPYSNPYLQSHGMPASLEKSPKHLTDALSDAVEETISKWSAQQEPFYLQVHPWAVHSPVQARADLIEAVRKRRNADAGSDSSIAYPAFVAGFDTLVGRIIKRLGDPNGDGNPDDSIIDNTLVIVTSDNGGVHADNLPLRGAKGEFFEGGIRVPLVAAWPGVIPAGSSSQRLVHAVDFYPTLLEITGATQLPDPEEHPLDGFSFAQTLRNPDSSQDRGPIFYLFPGYLDRRASPLACVIERVDGTLYKLIYHWEKAAWTLYAPEQNGGEQRNLADQQPAVARHLAKKLLSWLKQEHPTWRPRYPRHKLSGQETGPPPMP